MNVKTMELKHTFLDKNAEISKLNREAEFQKRELAEKQFYVLSLERQISDKRAEVERLRKICDPETEFEAIEMIASVKQGARQEVARDILHEINKYYVGGQHDYYHITIEDLIGIVKDKFELEG